MGSNAKPLQIRLFIEGEEVPVISASVSMTLNSPASASIQIIPLDSGRLFLPRSMVHLFFLERPARPGNAYDLSVPGRATRLAEDYRLLFSGEVIGYSWTKSAMGRGLVLNCLDFTSYWDACYAGTIDYSAGGNLFNTRDASGGGGGTFSNLAVDYVSQRIAGWLSLPPLTPGLQHMTGIAGGIIRVMEGVSGVEGRHRGVNDFFTVGELRCKLLEQIVAEQGDSTSKRLMDIKVFNDFIQNSLQNLGSEVTLRQILITLAQNIYYDFVPNPAAMSKSLVFGTDPPTKSRAAQSSAVVSLVVRLHREAEYYSGLNTHEAATQAVVSVDKDLKDLKALTSTFKDKGNINAAMASLDAAKASADAASKIDETAQRDVLGEKMNEVSKSLAAAVAQIKKDKSAAAAPDTRQKYGSEVARLQTTIFRPDCWFAAPPRCNVIFPEQYTQLNYDRVFLGEATRLLAIFFNTLVQKDATQEVTTTKIFAPFSDSKTSVDMASKNKMDAAHFLMKHERHTGIVNRTKRISNIFAPVSAQTQADAAKQFVGASRSWGHKIALYSFFQERFYGRTASVSGKFNPYLVAGFPGLIITNPFILKGVDPNTQTPSATLEVVKDSENVRAMGGPAHLLGMITSLSHSIGQDGGQTSLSMNYVHEHFPKGDDAFLDLFSSEVGSVTKRISYTIKYADLNVDSPTERQLEMKKLLKTATPQELLQQSKYPWLEGAKTNNVSVVTETKTVQAAFSEWDSNSESYTEVPAQVEATCIRESQVAINGGLRRAEQSSVLGREVIHPVQKTGLSLGNTPGLYDGKIVEFSVSTEIIAPVTGMASSATSRETASYFSEVTFYEDVQIGSSKNVPIEEIIRPDWFSKNFSNPLIGKNIYEPFFGTGSIVDELEVEGLPALDGRDGTDGFVANPSEDSKDYLLQLLNDGVGVSAAQATDRGVNLLAYYYGLVKTSQVNGVGMDVAEFIDNYTWRPIAGMTDVLGSNLKVEVDAAGKVSVGPEEAEKLHFRVGFHSMAVNKNTVEKGKLTGLVQDPTLKLQRVDGIGESLPVDGEYDVRKEKRDAVVEYKKALDKGPAFRG